MEVDKSLGDDTIGYVIYILQYIFKILQEVNGRQDALIKSYTHSDFPDLCCFHTLAKMNKFPPYLSCQDLGLDLPQIYQPNVFYKYICMGRICRASVLWCHGIIVDAICKQ